jgi:hypothetical protein
VTEYLPEQISNVELRLSELQAQIDSLSVALKEWRQMQAHAQPTEQRLAELTEQGARIMESWRQTGDRHTEVVAGLEERLSEWGAIEGRLQHDSGERIRELQQTIEHEWQALRQIHEEPVKQLREQAATLGETCVAAANLALQGFERAESRLIALEQDLQARMTQMSRQLQTAIAELQSGAGVRPPSLPGPASTFPLESVMRIHEELRGSDDTAGSAAAALGSGLGAFGTPGGGPAKALPPPPDTALALTARMESLERAVGEAKVWAERVSGGGRPLYPVIGLVVVALAVAGAFGLWIERRVESRLNDAATRVAAAERQREATTEQANNRLAATRDEAARQVTEARRTALQAQIVGNVLAAPDLVRYNLSGTDAAPRAYGKVMWSRSRGLVFSASHLPRAPAGSIYQFWLLTRVQPVSAGLLAADTAGRITFVTDTPGNVPRPVVGAIVTLEPEGGRPRPAGTAVLSLIP